MPSITCDQCGKTFARISTPDDRNARCTCGSVIHWPDDPLPDEAAYDLAPKPPLPARKSPSSTTLTARPSTIVLGYSTPRDEPSANPEHHADNLYLPIWLLGGGIAIEIIAALLTQRHGVFPALQTVAVQLLVGTSFMLAGILLAAKFRGISLGGFWIAVLKLGAISVAPSAVMALFTPLLDHIPFGSLIGWAADFVLYFALLGALFDLDESDTWYCISVIFLLNLTVYFLLLWKGAR